MYKIKKNYCFSYVLGKKVGKSLLKLISKIYSFSWVWEHIPVIPVLRQKLEGQGKFKISWVYLVNSRQGCIMRCCSNDKSIHNVKFL